MPVGNGSITSSNSRKEKGGQECLYVFGFFLAEPFFFLYIFICYYTHARTLTVFLFTAALHCAPQFSAVALAILMGRSAVLSLIGRE